MTSLIVLVLLIGCNRTGPGTERATRANAKTGVKVGDPAPDFTLTGFPQQEFTLSQHRDQSAVVLYFYPKDNTPDCSTQACAFRDTSAEFQLNGAIIVGISRDDLASHALFADEFDLPFPLLYDQNNTVRQLFGNPDGSAKLIPRITYVIDRRGIVTEIISDKQDGDLKAHVLTALEAVKRLSSE